MKIRQVNGTSIYMLRRRDLFAEVEFTIQAEDLPEPVTIVLDIESSIRVLREMDDPPVLTPDPVRPPPDFPKLADPKPEPTTGERIAGFIGSCLAYMAAGMLIGVGFRLAQHWFEKVP